jgi:hypothetical protein
MRTPKVDVDKETGLWKKSAFSITASKLCSKMSYP